MPIKPNNNERYFDENKILVSKTDVKGRITYVNQEFMKIAGYDEQELVGKPHSIVRHPDMPRIIFKMLWEYLQKGIEIHAYVKNICEDGSFYWVIANVSPSFDLENRIIGFHSARRVPRPKALEVIKPLYAKLLEAEAKGGMAASEAILTKLLKEKGYEYDEFILSF